MLGVAPGVPLHHGGAPPNPLLAPCPTPARVVPSGRLAWARPTLFPRGSRGELSGGRESREPEGTGSRAAGRGGAPAAHLVIVPHAWENLSRGSRLHVLFKLNQPESLRLQEVGEPLGCFITTVSALDVETENPGRGTREHGAWPPAPTCRARASRRVSRAAGTCVCAEVPRKGPKPGGSRAGAGAEPEQVTPAARPDPVDVRTPVGSEAEQASGCRSCWSMDRTSRGKDLGDFQKG